MSTATALSETSNSEYLAKPNRWYSLSIGKFGGNIDVAIDGAEIFKVYDDSPREGPKIAVGTTGKGYAYFDDVLI